MSIGTGIYGPDGNSVGAGPELDKAEHAERQQSGEEVALLHVSGQLDDLDAKVEALIAQGDHIVSVLDNLDGEGAPNG